MHELSIAEALLEQIEGELQARQLTGVVRRVEVAVGRFAGVVPDALRFAFEVLIAETPLQGTRLEIRVVDPTCSCKRCAAKMFVQEWPLECPQCCSPEIEVVGGRELLLEAIEIDD